MGLGDAVEIEGFQISDFRFIEVKVEVELGIGVLGYWAMGLGDVVEVEGEREWGNVSG